MAAGLTGARAAAIMQAGWPLKARDVGRLQPGMRVMMPGFGFGYSRSGTIID
jgi:hypothetical protein